ncbi:hypothetical protein [Deinococcus multiflagellatus]|uniref:hypothetical protein n=1 Tax=Deinococcus multiflagellatus TaxID=1656887 RepID=UPI001CCD4593|nr:hypothetical protein [Deinococcus multiflagellatus]MBZ9715336.1 hypothetical protein [Deinococcus multiflagellatus]
MSTPRPLTRRQVAFQTWAALYDTQRGSLAEQQAFRQLGLVEADRRTRDLPAGFPCDGCQTATVAQPGFCARCTAPITRKDAGTGRAFAGLVLVFMVSGSFDQYKTLAAAPLSLWLLLGLSVLLMVWGAQRASHGPTLARVTRRRAQQAARTVPA